MKIEFTKMHGAGNDYIYVNTMKYPIENPEELAIKWSRPHFSVGSDGLILIGEATSTNSGQATEEGADFSMRIFNNDGSEAMMCGNGTRCVAKYLHDKGITDKNPIRLQTKSGIKVLNLHLNKNNEVETVTVDMGEPAPIPDPSPISASPRGNGVDRIFHGIFVDMGNPHFVIFMDEDVEKFPVEKYGPLLERHERFPQRCNIEFAQVLPDGTIRMRVWERGSGITLACGTGACATAVAAKVTGRRGNESDIKMDGGTLHIEWNQETNHIMMTGPAAISFEGEINI